MEKLDSIDYRLLWELIKNSRRSDRELAKAMGSSQPTVTRRRGRLEGDFIKGYTAIPEWEKIGFEIIAFTFVKTRIKYAKPEERKTAIGKTKEWMMKQPNVVFAVEGQGIGWDGVCVSFHKNYADFTEFIGKHNSELSEFLIESQSFIENMTPTNIVKPFHFKYLANVN